MSLFSFTKSIRQRILLSSFIVLILFALSSSFSLLQFSSTTDSFHALESVAEEAALTMELNADLAELQLDILHFSNVRHASAANRIATSLSRLEKNLGIVSARVSDEQRSATIDRMLQTYSNYAANIESMLESRDLEGELTETRLPGISARMFAQLKSIEGDALLDGNTQLSGRIQLVQEQLLESEIRRISFQVYRRHEDQLAALQFLQKGAESVADTIAGVELTPESETSLVSLQELIRDYETVFRQAIQAMRGSLFLVNVVMAGEAEEFSELAAQLKDSTLTIQNSLTQSVNAELDSASLTTSAVTLGAILLGVLLSLSLSQSILLPIQEISSVFKRLASGDVEGEIPGLQRRDEIGALAAAATVFKDVSLKTKTLLAESEALTSALQLRERELKAKAQELEKSVDQLNNFAYVASHDLKSPLRAIDNLAKWIAEDCAGKLPVDSASHLELMQQRIELMETLLDDLLLYSRVGKVEERIEEISVTALLEEVKMLSNIPEGFEIQWPQTDIRLNAHAVSLRQVFLNLFSNAFKYAASDRGLLSVDWRQDDEGVVTFSVADNGPGIEPRYHRKIFEMFQTLSTKDVYGGSGMGLAIVKKVVAGAGGSIRIESDLGAGANFIFTWPRDSADSTEAHH